MGTGNPAGSPPKGQRRITEGHYPELYGLWLRGTSVRALAAKYGVDWRAANYHLQKCREEIRGRMVRDREEVLDELREVRQSAWQAWTKSQRSLTQDEVQQEVNAAVIEKGISAEVAGQVMRQTTKVTLREGTASYLTLVLAAIDVESKLCGFYEVGKREGQKPVSQGEYRVAGRTPAQITEMMAARVHQVLSGVRSSLIGGSN